MLFSSLCTSLLSLGLASALSLSPSLQNNNRRGDGGINCAGSWFCGNTDGGPGDVVSVQISDAIVKNIKPDRWYAKGQQIACMNLYDGSGLDDNNGYGICAFIQGAAGANGSYIAALAPQLPAYNCNICGSVPFGYPQTNSLSDGMLTFNYVNAACLGIDKATMMCP